MPLLCFLCDACATNSEILQKYADPIPPCPKCGGEQRRGISTKCTFKFGPGFAADGYCSVTPKYRKELRKMKEAVNGRTRGDGATPRSALRGY